MSYNIDSIEVLKIDAFMYAKDIVKLADELEEVCEDNLLCNLYVSAVKALASKGTKSKVPLKGIEWRGEGSGRSFEVFEKHVAPKIHGHVSAVVTWEGGDSHSGFTIDDGVFKAREVRMSLV